ncbi:Uma2 family endonuclease [Streptomyces sp. NPDC002092]
MTEHHITRNLPHLLDIARDVEKRFEGMDVSVVDGVVMMSPVAPAHYRTQQQIDRQLRDQAGDAVLGEIEFAHPAWDRRLTPDVIVWHGDEEEDAPYDAEAIELAVEIVSPSSVENDYVLKPRAYATAGIPVGLVLDPYTRSWTLLTDPAPGGYRERATGPYGKTLRVDCGSRILTVATEGLPEAKEWQLRDAWPIHRTDPGIV